MHLRARLHLHCARPEVAPISGACTRRARLLLLLLLPLFLQRRHTRASPSTMNIRVRYLVVGGRSLSSPPGRRSLARGDELFSSHEAREPLLLSSRAKPVGLSGKEGERERNSARRMRVCRPAVWPAERASGERAQTQTRKTRVIRARDSCAPAGHPINLSAFSFSDSLSLSLSLSPLLLVREIGAG